jgi:hypothetical protein
VSRPRTDDRARDHHRGRTATGRHPHAAILPTDAAAGGRCDGRSEQGAPRERERERDPRRCRERCVCFSYQTETGHSCLPSSRRLRECPKLSLCAPNLSNHQRAQAARARACRSAEGTTPPGYAHPEGRVSPCGDSSTSPRHLGPEISPPSAVDLSRRPRTIPGTTGDLPTLEGPSSITAAARSRLRTVHRLRTVTISESCFPPFSPSLLSPHRA